MSPHSPAHFSFSSLGKNGLPTVFLSYEHQRTRLPISYCAFCPSQWGNPLRGSKAGCSSLELPAPQQDCHFLTNILNFLQSKVMPANLPVGGRFTQRRYLQLCLSSGVIHHNTILCLAQRKKSGSSQKAIFWQKKKQCDKRYYKCHLICSFLALHIETSLQYLHPTPHSLLFHYSQNSQWFTLMLCLCFTFGFS